MSVNGLKWVTIINKISDISEQLKKNQMVYDSCHGDFTLNILINTPRKSIVKNNQFMMK